MASSPEGNALPKLISSTSERLLNWDPEILVQSLVAEASLEPELAHAVSIAVEEQLIYLGQEVIPTSLVRDLAIVHLQQMGSVGSAKRYKRLGISSYDLLQKYLPRGSQVEDGIGDDANTFVSGRVKREFALDHVYPPEVVTAHLEGDIYIHGLEHFDSLYSSTQSLEFVKKFGLSLHHRLPPSPPAANPEMLVSQVAKLTQGLGTLFHGPIGWDALNIFFSSHLELMSDDKVEQLARAFIHEMSQQVYGGRLHAPCDFHLYWEVPKHLEGVIALGKSGKRSKKTYYEYAVESQRFLWSLIDAFKKGDSLGQPFFTPRPVVHITERFFQTPGHKEFLKLLSKVAIDQGTVNIVFDRNNTSLVNHCGHLDFASGTEFLEATEPWKMRYHSFQNVVVNLPRAGYLGGNNPTQIMTHINRLLESAAAAQLAKKNFIYRLLNRGLEGPLGLLTRKHGDRRFLRMDKLNFLISVVGLNELLEAAFGESIYTSEKSLRKAQWFLTQIQATLQQLSEKHKIQFVLDDVPTEKAKYRFAMLDKEIFPDKAKAVIKGEPAGGIAHYTDSCYIPPEVAIKPEERIRIEGALHPFIDGGATCSIWLGSVTPPAARIEQLIRYAFHETTCEQISFGPDFTRCFDCDAVKRGLHSACHSCESRRVDGIAKQGGSFTWVSHNEGESLFDLLQRYDNHHLLD